jgi:hypothetical protein
MDGVKSIQGTLGTMAPASAKKAGETAAPPQTGEKQEPQDSFVKGVLAEAKEMAVKGGKITSAGLGGAIGLGALTLGLYAGVAGGAIFLGALGAGVGPIVSAVTTKGILGFIGGSFKTMGLFAKAGIVLGGISTGLGSFLLAKNSAETLAAIPGMLIGGAVGLVTGTVHQIQKKLGGEE